MFKMAKNWSAAGSAFYEAAELHAKAGSRHDAANNYVDAANCFKKSDINGITIDNDHILFVHALNKREHRPWITDYFDIFIEAISCLLKAIEIYTDMGRFTMAAKHHQSIAEMYESEAVDLERAVSHYEQAADYFRGEESNSSANKCLLKVAQYAAQLENYDKAIQIYEQVTYITATGFQIIVKEREVTKFSSMFYRLLLHLWKVLY